jgi:DNA helicase II / ATP-dependent DNA helicase PcrA
MCNFIVTDEEINKAEQDIFLGQGTFSDEQKAFLKCLDSCSLQSYAGSGKTSTLVGKLHILAQKRVWETGRGICVISHTNIAVDEIKSRVANHYPEIMEYPNFVGTIQEFVNKFLFVPYLANLKMQIRFQDERRYLDYENDGDTTLKTRVANKLSSIRGSRIAGAEDRFWYEFHRLCFIDNKVVTSKKVTEYTDLTTRAFSQAESNTHLKTLIDKQQEKGNFLFVESFIYALEYLKQQPVFIEMLAERFNFVLLDEAQDCSEIQLKLLDELFGNNERVCFQQIGDINQSISEDAWLAPEPTLFLGRSLRCGSNLIAFVSGFCLNTFGENTITGSDNNSEKVLIVYSGDGNKDILEKFSEILVSKEIPNDTKKGYFAIAHEHDQLIESFPDHYSRESTASNKKSKSLRFANDIDYINLLTPDLVRKNGTHYVSNVLYRLLYKHFKTDGTWIELQEKLFEENSDFKKIVLDISNEILIEGGILDFPELQRKLNLILGEDLIKFNMKKIASTEIIEKTNSYKSSHGVDIRIGTIHSVKGQTHNATLFISDTQKRWSKYDIEHGLQNNQNERTKKYKKLIYVASSRPQNLFVFAIAKTAYDSLGDTSCFNDFEKINI